MMCPMHRKTFKLGYFVTIVPYWYNQYNKYCQSVMEANLSVFQQEVQSAQHKTSFWFGVFYYLHYHPSLIWYIG